MDLPGHDVWASTSDRARQMLLRVFLASIAVNALLGIWALLTGDFGQTEGKVLATSLLISAAMLSVLVNGAPLQQQVLWPVPAVAAVAGVASIGGFIVLMWAEVDHEVPVKLAASGLVIAAAATLAGLLALLPLRHDHEPVRWVTDGMIALLAVTVLWGLWFEIDTSWYGRTLGVESVLTAALALAIPVLWRFGGEVEADQATAGRGGAGRAPAVGAEAGRATAGVDVAGRAVARGEDLVARVEEAIVAERRSFAASTAAGRPEAGVLNIAGGCAVYTGHGLFSNRALGLGLKAPFAATDLDQIERFYHQRGATGQIEVASVAAPDLIRLLADRGYRLNRFRHILARSVDGPLPPTNPELVIETVDDSTREGWSRALIEGFGYQDAEAVARVEEWNAALLATPGLIAFVARSGGEVIGSASVFVSGTMAVLGGAATRPQDRRQGVQLSLIAARLDLAQRAGCDLAVVTADPGSASERNSIRSGFQLVCSHAVMAT